MGEKIRDLSKWNNSNTDYFIELNEPPSIGADYRIHIQSKKFRLDLPQNDYIKYALTVLQAAERLKENKK